MNKILFWEHNYEKSFLGLFFIQIPCNYIQYESSHWILHTFNCLLFLRILYEKLPENPTKLFRTNSQKTGFNKKIVNLY